MRRLEATAFNTGNCAFEKGLLFFRTITDAALFAVAMASSSNLVTRGELQCLMVWPVSPQQEHVRGAAFG